jgi:hypothetical protein
MLAPADSLGRNERRQAAIAISSPASLAASSTCHVICILGGLADTGSLMVSSVVCGAIDARLGLKGEPKKQRREDQVADQNAR